MLELRMNGAVLISIAMLIAATSASPAKEAAQTQLGPTRFQCFAKSETDAERFEITRSVDQNGRLVETSGLWSVKSWPKRRAVSFSAGWHSRSGNELDFRIGHLAVEIETTLPLAKAKLKGKRYAVGMSTVSNPLFSIISGQLKSFRFFEHIYPHLNVSWSDVIAMSKGSRELFVLARDSKHKILFSEPIDPKIFISVQREMERLDQDARKKADALGEKCDPYDPEQMKDIIVT